MGVGARIGILGDIITNWLVKVKVFIWNKIKKGYDRNIMEIVFATKNKGKIKELKHLVKDLEIIILSLEDINFNEEILENGKTYSENAMHKAKEISKFSNKIALADDSGIEILAYNNGPGVKSSRFSPELSYKQKNRKIIADLKGLTGAERSAKFICAIAIYTPGGKSFICKAECKGLISHAPVGKNGFGYDPIFFLPEYDKTFAELHIKTKNKISHRAKAFKKARKILVCLTR